MVEVREARKSDTAVIHQLIGELADFEKLRHEVSGSPNDLEQHLFGPEPFARVLIAESTGRWPALRSIFSTTPRSCANRASIWRTCCASTVSRRRRWARAA